ncbi:MAG: FAD:protein FMN transferase [Gammaproteobacteria bacterium]
MRTFSKNIIHLRSPSAVIPALLGLCLATGCGPAPPPDPIQGNTMGTVYTVRVARLPAGLSLATLAQDIENELNRVNAAMSTYREDSEISRFNRGPAGTWIGVSPEFAAVVSAGQGIGAASLGAFDLTVGKLVQTWGFGPEGQRQTPPSPAAVQRARSVIKASALRVRLEPPALLKELPELEIDLSAIAKGHGVDRLAALLDAAGIGNYLVDIGGDLRTRGRRDDGTVWRIGIERPLISGRRVQQVLGMSQDAAVATSGNYRNFFEADGKRYAHIVDPRTGSPVTSALASVSVIADDCTTADAWATALTVMGSEEGYELATRQGLSALFISRNGETFTERMTPAFMERFAAGQLAIQTGISE